MTAIEHDGHTWALDERNPPHVIKDGEDNGVSIQGEEALRSEVVSLRRQLAGAVGENARLRQGLRDFGIHAESCPRHRLFEECTCGLRALTEGRS
jgi:hypothetical protein